MALYAACSYCLGRAKRLDGSYLRTFALELKEQLAQTLAAFVTSILAGPCRRLDAERTEERPISQIIDLLQPFSGRIKYIPFTSSYYNVALIICD